MVSHARLAAWVEECARLCRPDRVVWCDGSERERDQLQAEMLRAGTLLALDSNRYPGCYLYRSAPSDVARTERDTYICSTHKDEAGPTNNWMAPEEAKAKAGAVFKDAMRGRTMYVVPYLMGPPGSPFTKVGIELTDSPYVVLSMRIMTRMGRPALEQLGAEGAYVPGLHSTADLDPQRRFILHFPDENLIWSVGSGYGGNALLGKKCLSLRLASVLARREGWLAEHMLILGIEDPQGRTTYLAAAFPSACGKTNLAMLVPPPSFGGYKIWTVGDDIAWLRIGQDGRLWAVNPEAGFFGVAPGTSERTNHNAMATLRRNALFTNVAMTSGREPWWEGMTPTPPPELTDWQGRPWSPQTGTTAAHPNARFTAPAAQCPIISPRWEDPQGVPISALIFGGRRGRLAPLVYEALTWEHGVYLGATLSSETTAAAAGQVGVLRRDPMAMLPFCGYHMADYFRHWLEMGRRIPNPPRIFHVNWFRKGEDGKFLWPGFGENIRVLQWISDRVRGSAGAVESPLGLMPGPSDLNLDGLNFDARGRQELFRVDPGHWQEDLADQAAFFARFGDRFPEALHRERTELARRLGAPAR